MLRRVPDDDAHCTLCFCASAQQIRLRFFAESEASKGALVALNMGGDDQQPSQVRPQDPRQDIDASVIRYVDQICAHITLKAQLEPEQVFGIFTLDTEFAKAAAFGVLTQLVMIAQHIDFQR